MYDTRKEVRMAGKLLNDEFFSNIRLNSKCSSLEEAIQQAGEVLVQNKFVTRNYISGMLERELKYPTYLDFGVMIPHGTEDSLQYVLQPGISIIQIPDGFPYLGHMVHLVIGISCKEDDPLQELMQITDILLKPSKRERLLNASSKQEFIDVINENYFNEGEL